VGPRGTPPSDGDTGYYQSIHTKYFVSYYNRYDTIRYRYYVKKQAMFSELKIKKLMTVQV